jgi:hypothetical protein
MGIGRPKACHRLWLGFFEHFFQGSKYQIHGKPMLTHVSLRQFPVGFGDSHNLNVWPFVSFKNPTYVAMIQSGHTDSKDFLLGKSLRNPQ